MGFMCLPCCCVGCWFLTATETLAGSAAGSVCPLGPTGFPCGVAEFCELLFADLGHGEDVFIRIPFYDRRRTLKLYVGCQTPPRPARVGSTLLSLLRGRGAELRQDPRVS